VSAASAVARRTFADSWLRTASFALLFAAFAYANAVGYRHSYPTLADRLAFARSFGANKAVRLFYGAPHDLLTVGGYCAWRVGGIASIFAGLWGALAAVRAMRAEEDAGRAELVLAAALRRREVYLAQLGAIALGGAILWLALFAGLAGARLDAAGSAALAVAVVSPVLVFAGVGAVASQLAPSRRVALEASVGALSLALLIRVVADTASGVRWLGWATPLGWPERLQAFAGVRPVVLVAPVLAGAALLAVAGWLSVRRDVGLGLLGGTDSAPPSLRLLSSPTAFALRGERGSLAAWLFGTGVYALVVGFLSTSFSGAGISESLRREIEKLGGGSITTPAGALGFYFLFFVLAISLFACSQVSAARREEAEQRLETLFALPVGRRGWLAGRLALAAAGIAALGLTAGALAWAGAATQRAGVSLPRLLEAGANCLPAAILFLALATLAYAVAPRLSTGLAYALVGVAFLWELVGGLLGAPRALLDLSPFEHIGLVPAQPFRATAALAMLAIAAVAVVASLRLFARRDLVEA
jgi:ABC-2 type transport system permease protein